MIKTVGKARTWIGIALGFGWIALLVSQRVAESLLLGVTLFVILYGATLFIAWRSSSPAAHILPKLAIVAIGAAVVLTFWGTLLDRLFLPSLIPTTTSTQRIALIVINGILAAAATGLAAGYLLVSFLGRLWWLPFLAATGAAGLLMFPSLLEFRLPSLGTWGSILSAADLFFLVTVAPLSAYTANLAAANNSFKPTPLRGAA